MKNVLFVGSIFMKVKEKIQTYFQSEIQQIEKNDVLILTTANGYHNWPIIKKIQSFRQLLNEEIQFNIKDLYMLVSANALQITVYHLQAFINGSREQGQENEEQGVYGGALESMIKGYNNCSSMNLSFIEFALIFLSRENKLLSKLAVERNSLGEIPEYLIIYSIKILELESQLHRNLINFRTKYSTAAENWIKQNTFINLETGQSQFDQKIIQ